MLCTTLHIYTSDNGLCICIPDVLTSVYLQWPHFFVNLLQCVQSGNSWTIDLYLRILMAIDCEVVDRQVVHSQEVGLTEQTYVCAT